MLDAFYSGARPAENVLAIIYFTNTVTVPA